MDDHRRRKNRLRALIGDEGLSAQNREADPSAVTETERGGLSREMAEGKLAGEWQEQSIGGRGLYSAHGSSPHRQTTEATATPYGATAADEGFGYWKTQS